MDIFKNYIEDPDLLEKSVNYRYSLYKKISNFIVILKKNKIYNLPTTHFILSYITMIQR